MRCVATFTHWVKPQWNNSAVPGSWSIACEVIFYLFFPFVAARVTNVRQAIGLVVFCGMDGVADISRQHGFTFYSFNTQAPCFAAGILVFRLLERVARACGGYFGARDDIRPLAVL
jgi:peptidoglycan/LPS O-acetylase OafA/YrhL